MKEESSAVAKPTTLAMIRSTVEAQDLLVAR